MKIIKNCWLQVVMGLMMIGFVACSKNGDVSAPPTVTKVTLLDSTLQDSSFTKALPGTLILITGQHLDGMVKVLFNGQEAYFNPTYNTSTHLIITIPEKVPTEAVDPQVPNKIKFITTHGEFEYNFIIDIPPPSIASVSNENALPGDSVFLNGSSMYLITKLVLPGNREITDLNTNPAGTRVGFVMPDLGSDTGRLVMHAKYGTATNDGPLNDHESGDVISNLTNDEPGEKSVFNWAWWGAVRTNDPALFPGTRGAYLQSVFGGLGPNASDWWNDNRSGNFNSVPMFAAGIPNAEAGNYALKFEMNTKEAWSAGIMVLRFNDKFCYRFMPYLSAADGKFSTKNKWQTVTIPISQFRQTADGIEGTGAPAVMFADILNKDAVVFGYRFITEKDPVDVYNAAFDNFRVIKIK
ncbi:hypothetical protein SAMN05444266_11410 [Chitinophaga jiangningensis]|uniref:Surface glycan-binding protein B xyloglucan binding domain-containing protein n=1 Tax=Chitinophaga jiangningensis TaxID=1419482 RepID=A0A1M7MPZ2_9BACT|nr:glycan-binding surface protein [Chitinophaga jiangningensis]SHM92575.1 hypothetical protein SAMN05444266_11410 [Chitinophaga jiangningensis]